MISIIIPVYNEEEQINDLLAHLPQGQSREILVVDGSSTDRTREIVSQYDDVTLLSSPRRRARQMNTGAEKAKGDILLFLHADCRLEQGSLAAIESALTSQEIIGGCLRHKIDSPQKIFRWIETSGDKRARLFGIFYGDQAIFVKRDLFFEIGKFDDVDLFDDVLFSKKMKKKGHCIVLDSSVTTSPRRWKKRGIIKTTLINWLITIGFLLHVHPEILKKLYPDVR